ncbi:MAG: hypothetical protein HDS65_00845 [Bacteroidales bacterium]|nr:hypothetical protein [Bacteroidales bacterium]
MLDASNYDQIILRYPTFGIDSAHRHYTLVRQIPTNTGVFHPKISMFFGENAGMLVVGSGNLTYNGQALNEEVWNTFSLKGNDSVYLPLFKTVWKYLNNLDLPDSILLKQQLRWMRDNTNWMTEEHLNTSDKVIINDEQIRFISNDSEGNIHTKLREIIGDERIISITTISPFYDTSGQTLRTLKRIFNPDQVNCVYSEYGIYPYDLMKEKPQWLNLYSWDDVFSSKRSNVHKLHAKIIQFTLLSRTIILSGSANVTNAAFSGAGDEACIAIISANPEDYVRNLGITINQKSQISPTKLQILTRPERISSDYIAKSVQITSAEVIDDTLTVLLNNECLQNSRLSILDSNGEELQIFEMPDASCKIVVEDFTLTGCSAVVIDSDSNEISNRIFIISEDDVARFNPNKTYRKLDSLLDSNIDWKDNLDGILSYLWCDNNTEVKLSDTKGARDMIKVDVPAKSVSSEEFDNIHIGSRKSVLALPDVRIVDFLLSSDKKQRDANEAEISDDTDSLTDIDEGSNEYNYNESISDKRSRDIQFIECIDRYSRRLRDHYDTRLSDLYSKAYKFGADIFKPDYANAACHVDVRDYSRILINIVLMWRELETNFEKQHGSIPHDFIRNMGKFLILARKGYLKTNDYSWHKCVEFHKELIVFCFLIIATQVWYGTEVIHIKLILTNLLDSCHETEDINIDEITELFKKKIDESNIPARPESMALIEKTLSEYNLFCNHRTDVSTIREVDFVNHNDNYSYRSGYGFFYVADIKVIRQTSRILYEMSLVNSGFDDKVKVIGGGRKIRALS